MITLFLVILFLGFAIALAITWWFLTEVLPVLVILYLAFLAVRFIVIIACCSQKARSRG